MPLYDPPLPCRLLLDPATGGAWQMAVDEVLLETAASGGGASLRFYEWAEPTLSLGYFQQFDERSTHRATRDCPLVRRQTGGGAILHDSELTYSLALPTDRGQIGVAARLYDVVHTALLDVLAGLGVEARLAGKSPPPARSLAEAADPARVLATSSSATISPNRNYPRQVSAAKGEAFLCFQRRAAGDVLLGEAKICGSARRRHGNAVLQHGSLLLAASRLTPELPGLEELTGRRWSLDILRNSWAGELNSRLGLVTCEGRLTAAELDRVRTLAVEKYDAARWNRRR